MASDILRETYLQNPNGAALFALELLKAVNSSGDTNNDLLEGLEKLLASPARSHQVDLSIILPIYNEEETIPELYQRLSNVLSNLGSYEVIFVNDGSGDRSVEMIAELHTMDSRIKLVNLSAISGTRRQSPPGLIIVMVKS